MSSDPCSERQWTGQTWRYSEHNHQTFTNNLELTFISLRRESRQVSSDLHVVLVPRVLRAQEPTRRVSSRSCPPAVTLRSRRSRGCIKQVSVCRSSGRSPSRVWEAPTDPCLFFRLREISGGRHQQRHVGTLPPSARVSLPGTERSTRMNASSLRLNCIDFVQM